MRKILVLIAIAYLLGSCVSVRKYNDNLNVLKSEKQLKSDVDFIYAKLKDLHPRLNWYISKKDLDHKFDSLKTSIDHPMTSNDFYLMLSPVVASIGEGHIMMSPLTKKLKIKESRSQAKSGFSPLFQFDFERFGDKTYITKNIAGTKNIKPGTEVIAVDNIKTHDLISKYSSTVASDGFNRTHIERVLSKGLPTFYHYNNSFTDSVLCQLKYNDTIKDVCLTRNPSNLSVKPRKKEKEKREEQGYDPITNTYSKNLSYAEPDSSVAILTINDFIKGDFKKFYSNSFKQLDSLKTKALILDIRDNPGGNISDAIELYSYLVDSSFIFLDRSEVASKNSLMHRNYFKGNPPLINVFFALWYPMEYLAKSVSCLAIEKAANDKYYFSFPESKLNQAKTEKFTGKVFVLINGGTFSASCLLASNLKGSKRAVFVGEETGGAYNGTVAGYMAAITLPESKLDISFGLAVVMPLYKTGSKGRGIFPDVEINPTLEDRIRGIDPEVQWVLDDIKGLHQATLK